MNTKSSISIPSRILLAFAAAMLVAVFFLPAWRIDLYAPQYPEGLLLNIWTNRLSGDVDIINGLNHYIGMKPFSDASFPEFKYLNYIVYFFIALGMAVAISGSKRLLLLYMTLTVLGGIIAMYDFYQWGYEYGHDLDPKAAIQVPGLTYQPPVFGHKRLLNFDAYSFPDIAGWLAIASTGIFFLVYFYESYKTRKKNKSQPGIAIIMGYFLIGFSCCTIGPEPLVAGKDTCSSCKMSIIETQYGCELVTLKGRVYKFDDIVCIKDFIHAEQVKTEDIKLLLVSDFKKKGDWLSASNAWFYSGLLVKSPMGSNTIAFATQAEAVEFKGHQEGTVLNWSAITSKD